MLGTLAVVGAVLVAAFAAGCAGFGDDGGSEAVPSVGLMHVGLDHIPGSFPALATQLEEEYGWDLPEVALTQCVDEKRTRCVLAGEQLKLVWTNLDVSEAETQADVFVGQGVDAIVAFEDSSIDAAQKATIQSQTPIVFLHPSDPVRDGLVSTLDRPDRNLTGVYGARDEVDNSSSSTSCSSRLRRVRRSSIPRTREPSASCPATRPPRSLRRR
jgi:hypothetical protein